MNTQTSTTWDELESLAPAGYSKDPLRQYQKDEWDIDRIRREKFTFHYGWAFPSIEAIEAIAKFAGDELVLEVFAGRGLWAKLLQDEGVRIMPTDILPGGYCGRPAVEFPPIPNTSFTEVEQLEATAAVRRYRQAEVLMFIWPPYGNTAAYKALKAFKGHKVVYVGEWDGCTGDEHLRTLLETKWEQSVYVSIPSYVGIYDNLWLMERG